MRTIWKVLAFLFFSALLAIAGFASTFTHHSYVSLDTLISLTGITPFSLSKDLKIGFGIASTLEYAKPGVILSGKIGFIEGNALLCILPTFNLNMVVPLNSFYAVFLRGMVDFSPLTSGYYTTGFAVKNCTENNMVILASIGAGTTFKERYCYPPELAEFISLGIIALDNSYNQIFGTFFFRSDSHVDVDFGISFSF